jgi:hypothetical protein
MDDKFWKWAGNVDATLKFLKESVGKVETSVDNHLKHHQNMEIKSGDRWFKIIILIVNSGILIYLALT